MRLYHSDKVRTRLAIKDNSGMGKPYSGATLFIVCGLPGSGKTTYAKLLGTQLRAFRFSADEWMEALSINLWDEVGRSKIEVLQWKCSQQVLALGLSVIIEWGTWGRSERDALRIRTRELGAAVELHYLSVPVDVLFERVQSRRMEDPPITREQIVHWANMFQVPTSEEAALFDKFVTVQY